MSDWIEYGKSWDQFCEDGLNTPGTQIDVQSCSDKDKHDLCWIGDINRLGGTCGCCTDVWGNETIIRYRGVKDAC